MNDFADAAKTNPKQTQSNPTCSELACGEQGRTVEPISKAKKCPGRIILPLELILVLYEVPKVFSWA